MFPAKTVGLTCRNQLAGLVGKKTRDFPVNIIKKNNDRVLFVNGRLSNAGDLPTAIEKTRQSTVFYDESGSGVVAVLFRTEFLGSVPEVATPTEYNKFWQENRKEMAESPTSASMYGHCWDFVNAVPAAIIGDYESLESELKPARSVKVHDGAHFVNGDHIYLSDGVEVLPSAVLDATEGPIFVGPATRIEPQATIFGPCYIGPNCTILAGKVTASSIGHSCRVGGEVEQSIFQSSVNKYHDGFIGHSYVGSWVNFGAMTTNSDLKNNYSSIRVTLNGNSLDTGSIKVGSFIGDHTKFGIGTLLNTGINIGAASNLYGGGLIADKEIKPFSWGDGTKYVAYEFDKAIQTAKAVAKRRGDELTDFEIEALRAVAEEGISDEGILSFA